MNGSGTGFPAKHLLSKIERKPKKTLVTWRSAFFSCHIYESGCHKIIKSDLWNIFYKRQKHCII